MESDRVNRNLSVSRFHWHRVGVAACILGSAQIASRGNVGGRESGRWVYAVVGEVGSLLAAVCVGGNRLVLNRDVDLYYVGCFRVMDNSAEDYACLFIYWLFVLFICLLFICCFC
jgi:hypothetical protein